MAENDAPEGLVEMPCELGIPPPNDRNESSRRKGPLRVKDQEAGAWAMMYAVSAERSAPLSFAFGAISAMIPCHSERV